MDPEHRQRLSRLDVASVCDTDKSIRVLDPGVRPVNRARPLVGTAFPVACDGDFLSVLKALDEAAPGDVLVVDAGGSPTAVAGEIFATEAARKGLAGIVVDGTVRDTAGLGTIDLPVYARHVRPMAGTTDETGPYGVAVRCGGVAIAAGEVLFGDADGIAVLAPDELDRLLPAAEKIMATEAAVLARVRAGTPLAELLNLREHYEARLAGGESHLAFRSVPTDTP